MRPFSRRKLLKQAGTLAAATAATTTLTAGGPPANEAQASPLETFVLPLDGEWRFTLIRTDEETKAERFAAQFDSRGWDKIRVPHTWQMEESWADLQATGLYRTYFQAPGEWAGQCVRIEFEAVTHTARVWMNEKLVGSHERKGYTAFAFEIGEALKFGQRNALTVQVDNRYNTRMLPREESFDWRLDGGIIRPVSLLVTPRTHIERIEVDATPRLEDAKSDLKKGVARTELCFRAVVRNASEEGRNLRVRFRVSDDQLRDAVFSEQQTSSLAIPPASTATLAPPPSTEQMQLWHFDRPKLYRVTAILELDGQPVHALSETFGVRKLEINEASFFLNGQHVRLMGVERMAGSHPDYGMAEPSSWIEHDHDDLKELNCVLTRCHWPQDKRVLDYCDRRGILIQEEVPGWGSATFKGMGSEPSAEIMQNGLEQLREMIGRGRNHPSVFAWGLSNEIDGKNPPAQKFIRRLAEEARKLDPSRLLTYASHSLYEDPESDVAGELDFISSNEYYGSWREGDAGSVRVMLEAIHRAFPAKPVVVSEYGYCECTPDRQGGDARRIEILREHTKVFREYPYVAGAIFFSYNDYRTHIGDKGFGPLKQRVHGVVDLYGERKPSFEALRTEASPFEKLDVRINGRWITASMSTRLRFPAYPLEGYTMRYIVYGFGDLPVEQGYVPLPRFEPGDGIIQEASFEEKNPKRIRVDLLRPTGFSAITGWWKPDLT